MFFKKLVIASMLACVSLVGMYLVRKNAIKKADDILVVGIMSGYEPFACLQEDGSLKGFDIDVARQLAKRCNKKLVFKDLNVAGLLLALDQGKIDVLISGLSITQERERKIAMIYYQGSDCTTYPLVFWKSIPDGVRGLDDLAMIKNAVVCVEPGSTQEAFLAANKSDLSVKTMHAMSDIVLDLKYGKSTAALLDPDIAPELMRKNPELVSLAIPLPVAYQSRGCGIGINKKNTQLIAIVQGVIGDMLRDGTIVGYEQAWFGTVTTQGRLS